MHEFWEKVEHYNAKLIPAAIIILLGIIIIEFVPTENYIIKLIVRILDGLVIAIFVIDLIFLGIKAKNTVYFFKNYWLDVVAIFPFSLLFNVVNEVYRVVLATERLAVGQAILHESLEAKKGIGALAKSGKLAKMIKITARLIRVITKSRLFTHMKAKHHLAKRNLKTGKNTRKNKIKRKRN